MTRSRSWCLWLLPSLLSCAQEEAAAPPGVPPQRIAVIASASTHQGVVRATQDLERLLAEVPSVELVAPADAALVLRVLAPGEGPGGALSEEGFALVRTGEELSLSAPDPLGLQYAHYELLERLGLLFVHPRQTIRPARLCLTCLDGLDLRLTPAYRTRGWHAHTMHPLEHERALLEAGEENLAEAKRLVDFYVTQKLDFFQFALLDTVYLESWLPHAAAIVAYAHARGVRVGIVAPYLFSQQNAFTLIDPATAARPETHVAQLEASVDRLMVVPWDTLAQEMGSSEFLPTDDLQTVAILNHLVEYVSARWPGTTVHTKVHSSQDQTAPNFGDMNFNFLAGVCDPRLGVLPHTVQWYDLYRPAPTYDQTDFFPMRAFLLGELGERTVLYYPESSYWVTFDGDVPLFLPAYAKARWLDLKELRGSGMDGQVNFASGFEWGAWLNDRAAAWNAFHAEEDWTGAWRNVCATLGAGASEGCAALRAFAEWQDEALHAGNGIRWLIAWDNADLLGHELGKHGQPVRPLLHEVAALDGGALDAFERDELPSLLALAGPAKLHRDRLEAVAAAAPPEAAALWDELALGAAIVEERARFVEATYRAAIATRRRALGGVEDPGPAIAAAGAALGRGLGVVRRQEAHYRFPLEELAADRPSYTIYPFGLYRPVHDLWYWQRELAWARDASLYDPTEGLYDVFGKGVRPPPP